jgi:3-oxoacyl-[acyl-carrier protein] reductase
MSETRPGEEVAIVSGGARGIGAAICRRLSADGAAVCVADIDQTAAAELVDQLGRDGRRATSISVDVADPDSFRAAAAHAVERLGELTILINNAGVTRPSMVHRMSDQEWDLVHDVVLRGAFNGVRAVAPWFRDRERRRGRRIVNISSVSYHGGIGGVNYSSAKAGVVGLTRAIAHEWAAFGVTVNAVAPGYINVGLSQAIPDDTRAQIEARIPLGRAGTPEDVAAAVAFFCRAEAGFVTAQILDVDGGMPDMRPR